MKQFKAIFNIIILAFVAIASISMILYAYFMSSKDILFNLSYILTLCLLGFTAIGIIGFAIYFLATNFNKAKTSLIGVAIFAAILLISFILSKGETGEFYDKFGLSYTQVKLVGAGLIATYITFVGVILVAIYSEISKFFK